MGRIRNETGKVKEKGGIVSNLGECYESLWDPGTRSYDSLLRKKELRIKKLNRENIGKLTLEVNARHNKVTLISLLWNL